MGIFGLSHNVCYMQLQITTLPNAFPHGQPTAMRHLARACRFAARQHHNSQRPLSSGSNSKNNIAFPWQPCKVPLNTSPSFAAEHPLTRYVINPIKRELTRFFARTFIHQAYGELYVDYQFPFGAADAFEKFCKVLNALSDPNSGSRQLEDQFRAMLTNPLHDRLTGALKRLEANGEQISIDLHLYDTRITSLNVLFGPQVPSQTPRLINLTSSTRYYTLGAHHYLFRGFSLGAIFKKQDIIAKEMTPYQLGVHAMDEGAVVGIEVTLLADVKYHHRKIDAGSGEKGKTIEYQSCKRREIVVLFEGRHITQEDAQEGTALAERHWRIGDIDSLVEWARYSDFIESDHE